MGGDKKGIDLKNWKNWAFGTVFSVLIGSAPPTWIELYKSSTLGTSFGNSLQAEEQVAMWKKNFACMKDAKVNSLTNPHNIEIGVMVCDSGDVLISGKRPGDSNPAFRWVSVDKVIEGQEVGLSLSFISSAQANNFRGDYLPYIILCQWFSGSRLIMRVAYKGRGCYDLEISPSTGGVVSSHAAPCSC